MSQVPVCCPNPACEGRSVEGETVNRAAWEATWNPSPVPGILSAPVEGPGFWSANIHCPECATEGIDPESGQLDSAEEELGERCECGVVVAFDNIIRGWDGDEPAKRCPHCNAVMPWKDPA